MSEMSNNVSLRAANNDYRVNVEVFEGPLDLLMHLIKKNDLDIYDIPIAFVLEEYVRYLDSLKELNIDLAGEFLLLAAELAHIKSQLLLPEEPKDEKEEEDPRADLVRRLLEYQQFKEAGEEFFKRTILCRDVYVPLFPERPETPSDGPVEGSIFDLVETFSKILKRAPSEAFHNVAVDRISINDRIYQIVDLLKKDVAITIENLIQDKVVKYDIVITFLAILEMCRLKMIKVYQQQTLGQIYIQRTMDDVSEEDVERLIEIEATGFEKA